MAKKKKKNRTVLFVVIGILLLVGFGFLFKKKKKKEIEVATALVEQRTITETVSASGKVFPAVEVEISSNISGTIIELLVEEGQEVKKGMLLAKIDADALASVVERTRAAGNTAKAQWEAAKAQKDQLQAQFKNTEIIYKRNQELFKEGLIAQAEFDASQAAYETALANIKAAEQNIKAAEFSVKSAEATIKEQEKNLSQTKIYAPMNGVVSQLNKKEGEQVVGTAQMAGTPILKIANLSSVEVRVDVHERDVLDILLGDTADVELDAYPNELFQGVVTQIANTASNLNQLQLNSDQITNFQVKILLLPESYKALEERNKKSPFRAGLSASAEIRTQTVKNVLAAPLVAVTARVDELKKKKKGSESLSEYVFVQQGDSVDMRKVEIGIQDDEYIQILKGLNSGESVVKAPYDAVSKKLEKGKKVKVVLEDDLYKAKDD